MSQAVVHGGIFYSAGQVDSSDASVRSQTKAILAKIDALLEHAGSRKSLVLSANIWLSDISTFSEMNEVWEAWIDAAAPPARATVESRLAGPEYKVEISVIAAVSD